MDSDTELDPLDLDVDFDAEDMIRAWLKRNGVLERENHRRSKMNGPLIRRLEKLLTKGVPKTSAARACGIGYTTIRRWEKRHPNFAAFIADCEAKAIENLLDTVTRSDDPHAAVKLLRTKDGFSNTYRLTPEQWDRKVAIEQAKAEAEVEFLKARAAAENTRARAMEDASAELENLLKDIESRQHRKREVIDHPSEGLPAPTEP